MTSRNAAGIDDIVVSPTLLPHLPQHDVSCHVPIIRREPVQAASRSRSSEASSSASDACGRGSRGSTSRWRVAFLVVLGVLLVPARGGIDLVAWLAAGAWAIAGAIAWVVGSWVEVDVRRRRLAHDQSGLRSIGGWRLAAGATPQDPNVLLAMDLLVYLVDHVTLARVPIRGRRHRSRVDLRRAPADAGPCVGQGDRGVRPAGRPDPVG